jgi:hypothetical protein
VAPAPEPHGVLERRGRSWKCWPNGCSGWRCGARHSGVRRRGRGTVGLVQLNAYLCSCRCRSWPWRRGRSSTSLAGERVAAS